MSERNFYEAVAHRRTNYALGKNIPVTEVEIIETVEKVTKEVPSAFNMQSGRVIIALGKSMMPCGTLSWRPCGKSCRPTNSRLRKPR